MQYYTTLHKIHVAITVEIKLLIRNQQYKAHYGRLFVLTPAAEKTKTQGENSSQKLKKKTSTLGEQFLPASKTQENNLKFENFYLETKFFIWSKTFQAIFVYKYFQNQYIWGEIKNQQ